MPRYGPWKTPLNPYPVTASIDAPVGTNGYQVGYQTSVTSGGVPSLTPFAQPTIATITTPGGSGPTVEQTKNVVGPNDIYTVFTGFQFVDMQPFITPANPSVVFPLEVDTSDPDYLRFDWINIEYAAASGSLRTDLPITFTLKGTVGAADLGPLAALPLVTGSEYGVTDINTSISLSSPSLDSARWAAALTATNSGGPAPQYVITDTVAWSALDTGRYRGWQFRAGGATWAYGPADPDGTNGGETLFLVTAAWYNAPQYRFVYATGRPPLRQFPRDDALGGAPRQGNVNQPTSVQGSARQGWRATYR